MSTFKSTSWQRLLAIISLAVLTVMLGCATGSGENLGRSSASFGQSRDYFPGGAGFYNYGQSQSKENFANVERAQSSYRMNTKERVWANITPSKPFGNTGSLQTYYPLDVRWKLKDGREFFLENIDVRAIMQEYFKTHQIILPYQREGRARAVGDAYANLVHEIKDDTVIIKWHLTVNKTPVIDRLSKVGVAPRWVLEDEEHIVTTLKGKPTSGINFKEWVETIR